MRQTAPRTFDTKKDAEKYLAQTQTDLARGSFIDHRAGQVTFLSYASDFIANGGTRGRLAPRTAELYEDLLQRDLEPFHAVTIASVKPQDVRSWYVSRAAHPTRQRQAYALAKAVFGTAVRDRLIASNPCTIVGAGVAKAEERPYLAPDVLATIVAAMPEHYRTPLAVAYGAHLRLGELIGLQRGDFDADAGTLRVERQVVTVKREVLTTKTKTGQARTVALPPSTRDLLTMHLAATRGSAKSPMFVDANGERALTRNAAQQAWAKAAKGLGLSQFHLHDVRHAGLTTAAQAGATTRELMARAGHRTTAAAMVYQHVAQERSHLLAERMDALSMGTNQEASGTYRAREAIDA
ncbi:tyrosine-type recombinase/integrase [Microbacterium sp. NPDC058389]|uniref:tyrosine-type recombinase/integrase n=1 Tax=Microbacterium sp. NPDC058389 TaxID=3346475 RepID=UPI0036669BBC